MTVTPALTAPNDLLPYETGTRGETGRAAFVLRPGNTVEAARMMADCVVKGIRVVPQGANTGLVGGSVPDASGVQAVMSTDRLHTAPVIDPVERTATVTAGTRLSALNAAAEPYGLHFPIDLGADPMLGGMIATNTGGARFLRYGDVRRRTLGLTVVLPDSEGTTLKLGGLRKDNSGIDWKQLFIGTGGVFGLVTEAVIDLASIPRQTAVALIVPSASSAVTRLLVALEQSFGDTLSAFEMMSGAAIRAAIDHVPSLRSPFPGTIPEIVLLVEIAFSHERFPAEPSLDEVFQTSLENQWETEPDLIEDALFGPPETFWALRHTISEGVRHAGRLVAFDLGFKRGAVMGFRDAVCNRLDEFDPDLKVYDFGHVGDGGLHLNLVLPRGETRPQDWEDRLRDVIVDLARAHGGSFSAEHGIGAKNQRFYDTHTHPLAMRLADGIADTLNLAPMGAFRLGTPPEIST
ncbi:MAG: FAD-binding oxidoreductase [Pseudomonadota bacterium]